MSKIIPTIWPKYIPRSIIDILSIAFAIVVFIFGALLFQESYHLQKTGIVTIGTVTEVIPVKQGRRQYKHNTFISFVAENDETYTFSKRSFHFQPSDKLSVIYAPENPSNAKVNEFNDLWIESAIFLGCSTFSIIYILLQRLFRK